MTKNILFNIVLILFALTSCTPSTVNVEEETNASQKVNPNAEIIQKYDSFLIENTYRYHNLELYFDEICYRDTTHLFDFLHTWNRSGCRETKVWSNGLQSSIILRIVSPTAQFLILQYKGTELVSNVETHLNLQFLNDIDEDGYAEIGYYNKKSEQPYFVNDSIECDIYGSELIVLRLTGDTVIVDSLLTRRATWLEFPVLCDSIISGDTIRLVESKYIDFNTCTLNQLERL